MPWPSLVAMLISALLYASILATLWQYGEGRRLSGTDVGRSVLLRHLSASSLIFAGKKHLLARARTRILSIVSHKIFQLRLLEQPSCDDGSTAENFTYLSCTGMPCTRLGCTATDTPARESSLAKVFTTNALIINYVD